MPTDPNAPDCNAAVERLSLGIDSPRGAQSSTATMFCSCVCFEVETSYSMPCGPCPAQCTNCFEAE